MRVTSLQRRVDVPEQFTMTGWFAPLGWKRLFNPDEATHQPYPIPLELVGLFPIGSIWRDQRRVLTRDPIYHRSKRILNNKFAWAGHVTTGASSASTRFEDVIAIDDLTAQGRDRETQLIAAHSGGVVSLSCFEVIRFYFGALSFLFNEAIDSLQRYRDLRGLYDPARTRISDRTLHLVPHWRLRDRASLIVIGLLAAHPDIAELYRQFVQQILAQARGDLAHFQIPLPAHAGTLRADCVGPLRTTFAPLPAARQSWKAHQVVSDFRPALFDRIAIDNRIDYRPDLSSDMEAHSSPDRIEREIERAEIEEIIEIEHRGGTVRSPVPLRWQSLQQSFPNYAGVPVTFDGDTRHYFSTRLLNIKHSPVEAVSVCVSRARQALRPASVRPDEQIVEDQIGGRKHLFRRAATLLPDVRLARVADLAHPLHAFAQAKLESLHYAGGFDPYGTAPPDHDHLVAMNPQWGRYARTSGQQMRHYSVLGLNFGGFYVYALQIERSAGTHEASLGVVAQVDGRRLSPLEIPLIAQHACGYVSKTRKSGGEMPVAGIWPSGFDYADVRAIRLLNTQPRRRGSILADAIDQAARNLRDLAFRRV